RFGNGGPAVRLAGPGAAGYGRSAAGDAFPQEMSRLDPRSLYIHVPFCVRRCSYCDFAVQATREPPVGAWLEAVTAELRLQADAAGWALPLTLDTIYVGGGTPSLLGGEGMEAL